ncbi:DUF3093 domain-containing protein [Arthrobacter roseus]|uniref:DUF3093 domain-containing protein n=1 Tax=Arthrobacter roseus TaxID=136274 RepID=UPI001964F5F5|nr:DUF3093 domain-containing protein [Arthrobacter roseus]MBM7848383.1 cytochrome c oxidase assembly factor CtaG [Arthrobacter roseus]
MSTPDHQSSAYLEPLYEEKLWPALWIWAVAACVAGASVLVFAPINITTGIIAAIVVGIVLAVLLLLSTPRIRVTRMELEVGRARIERRFVGGVEGFLDEAATEQRGTALNALAFQCIRGWISPVVRIEITDEMDRTPYWITSTRHPEKLVSALTSKD